MPDAAMPDAAEIREALERRFEPLAGKVGSPRQRRLAAEVPPGLVREVLEVAAGELGFDALCSITGLDERTALAAVYHLSGAHGVVLGLAVRVPREDPRLRSVADLFPVATLYERELEDLFGFAVEGLAAGPRYPLPDGWPPGERPLRKDWPPAAGG